MFFYEIQISSDNISENKKTGAPESACVSVGTVFFQRSARGRLTATMVPMAPRESAIIA